MALINDFLSLIYPVYCEACSVDLYKHEKFICNKCLVDLPRSNFHLNAENELSYVLSGRIPFQQALALFVFEKRGRVQNLLHAIKYKKQKELAQYIGQLYAYELSTAQTLNGVDVIVPIPLHPRKLKLRGFNQSEWFAKGLSEVSGIPCNNEVLIRTAETSTQTRKKKFERWENVEGIFSLKDHEQLKNKHVLLADDVITTGATLEAAWETLKQIEGIQISVIAIAFAKKAG